MCIRDRLCSRGLQSTWLWLTWTLPWRCGGTEGHSGNIDVELTSFKITFVMSSNIDLLDTLWFDLSLSFFASLDLMIVMAYCWNFSSMFEITSNIMERHNAVMVKAFINHIKYCAIHLNFYLLPRGLWWHFNCILDILLSLVLTLSLIHISEPTRPY